MWALGPALMAHDENTAARAAPSKRAGKGKGLASSGAPRAQIQHSTRTPGLSRARTPARLARDARPAATPRTGKNGSSSSNAPARSKGLGGKSRGKGLADITNGKENSASTASKKGADAVQKPSFTIHAPAAEAASSGAPAADALPPVECTHPAAPTEPTSLDRDGAQLDAAVAELGALRPAPLAVDAALLRGGGTAAAAPCASPRLPACASPRLTAFGAGPSVPESPRGFDVDAAEELELELALAVSLEEASLAPASPPAVGGSGTVHGDPTELDMELDSDDD